MSGRLQSLDNSVLHNLMSLSSSINVHGFCALDLKASAMSVNDMGLSSAGCQIIIVVYYHKDAHG